MVEIPRFSGGNPHSACLMCPARTWLDGKHYCEPAKFAGDENSSISKQRPFFCPNPPSVQGTPPDAYALLKRQLRGG